MDSKLSKDKDFIKSKLDQDFKNFIKTKSDFQSADKKNDNKNIDYVNFNKANIVNNAKSNKHKPAFKKFSKIIAAKINDKLTTPRFIYNTPRLDDIVSNN